MNKEYNKAKLIYMFNHGTWVKIAETSKDNFGKSLILSFVSLDEYDMNDFMIRNISHNKSWVKINGTIISD